MAETKLAKWGNSQAVVIPKHICQLTGLSVGDRVKVCINPRNRKIEITQAEASASSRGNEAFRQ